MIMAQMRFPSPIMAEAKMYHDAIIKERVRASRRRVATRNPLIQMEYFLTDNIPNCNIKYKNPFKSRAREYFQIK